MVLQRNSTNETDRLINNKKTLPRLKKEEQDAKQAFHTSIIGFCFKKKTIFCHKKSHFHAILQLVAASLI